MVVPETVYTDRQLVITRTASPAGLELAGAIDYSNVDAVAQSLASALDRGGDLHLELSRLEFADVSGIRALVAIAETIQCRLRLHGMPPRLQYVMTTVGWSDSPHIVLCNGSHPEP